MISDLDHMLALRKCDHDLFLERDRRWTEVGAAKAEALRVREESVREALELARQGQNFRDLSHNGLLDQIKSERASMATKSELRAGIDKIEATLLPIVTYVAGQQGRSGGLASVWAWATTGIVALGALILLILNWRHV